jgi:hypothetical protein
MNSVKGKVKIVYPIIGVALLVIIPLYIFGIHDFLSVNQRLDADALIVEGFLPDYALESAVGEFHSGKYSVVITTGIPLPAEYRMPFDGRLVYVLPDSLCSLQGNDPVLSLRLFGTSLENVFAHFNVYVNGQLIGEGMSEAQSSIFTFNTGQFPECIRCLEIEFDNDAARAGEDRDLYVEEVLIGSLRLPARSPFSRYHRGLTPGGPAFDTMLMSLAEVAADQLIRAGMPAEKVIPVSTSGLMVNRTRASALSVWEKMDSGQLSFNSANVVSLGVHARRSCLLYKRRFTSDAEFGVISVRNDSYEPGNWWRSPEGRRTVVMESVKYLYTVIFLW